MLVAGEQTAGRGRLARRWESPAGASVAMSLAVEPKQTGEHWGWLSLLAGVAVASAIDELAPDEVGVGLKWPNDVLIGGKKLCGILSERIDHDGRAFAVVGIGINLALEEAELPVAHATSLALAGFDCSTTQVVAGVLKHFAELFRIWERDGHLRDAYVERCTSIGADLTITLPDGARVDGTGIGVDTTGALIVETAHGPRTYSVGDVVHATISRA